MTNIFQIISEWIDSCNNEIQLDNLKERLTTNAWKLDEKTADDLIIYLNEAKQRRSWVAAKVAQRDYTKVSDEYPDFIEHH